MVLEERVIDRLKNIDEELYPELHRMDSLSLMNGMGGLVLFYLNLYYNLKEEIFLTKATSIVEQISTRLEEVEITHSYCDGMAGTAFLFNYLKELNVLGEDVEAFLADIDDYLYGEAIFLLGTYRDLDFLYGGLGLGHYLLSRQGSSATAAARAVEVSDLIVDLVYRQLKGEIAVNLAADPSTGPGTPPALNTGMAHGMSAVVVYLSRYLARFPEKEHARETLSLLVDRLLRFKNPQAAPDGAESVFPSIVRGSEAVSYEVPLGWCYGDVTVSIALLHAGKVLGSDELVKLAESVALAATHRDSPETAIVRDACFCHGTASLAQAYRIWYQHTGNPQFGRSYLHWINKTLEMGSFTDGVGGYKKFSGTETPGGKYKYESMPGMLDGSCGIGLVLSDFLGTKQLDWERFFLWN